MRVPYLYKSSNACFLGVKEETSASCSRDSCPTQRKRWPARGRQRAVRRRTIAKGGWGPPADQRRHLQRGSGVTNERPDARNGVTFRGFCENLGGNDGGDVAAAAAAVEASRRLHTTDGGCSVHDTAMFIASHQTAERPVRGGERL